MADPIKGPLLELQGASVAVLRADAALLALLDSCRCSMWLLEDVPAGTPLPYVTLGEGQVLPDQADCIDGSEIYFDFHAWSKRSDQVKQLLANVWAVLSAATLPLSENKLILLERSSERQLRDPDGTTWHGVLTLRALTEPA